MLALLGRVLEDPAEVDVVMDVPVDGEKFTAVTSMVSIIFLRWDSVDPVADVLWILLKGSKRVVAGSIEES